MFLNSSKVLDENTDTMFLKMPKVISLISSSIKLSYAKSYNTILKRGANRLSD
jgi:hypothetical protein